MKFGNLEKEIKFKLKGAIKNGNNNKEKGIEINPNE